MDVSSENATVLPAGDTHFRTDAVLPNWTRALDLRERVAILRHAQPHIGSRAGGLGNAADKADGKETANDALATRLEAIGIDLEEYHRALLLPESPALTGALLPPVWASCDWEDLAESPWAPDDEPWIKQHPGLALTRFTSWAAIPVIRQAEDALTRMASHTGGLVIVSRLLPVLRRELVLALTSLVESVLVLELNIARIEGRLTAATPEGRYWEFIDSLANVSTVEGLCARYPRLARQVHQHCHNWLDAGLELFARLERDRALIERDLLHGHTLPPIVGIRSAGDPHRGLRRVTFVDCQDGTRIVYKPRPMGADLAFQAVLSFFNDRGIGEGFKTVSTVDRGTYGWSEAIVHEPCHDLSHIETFYRRQGGLLAILYALGAVDCHFENLIASGSHPVVVDLEGLFHHDRPPVPPEGAEPAWMEYSVLSVGLLPRRVWRGPDHVGVDMSGFGGQAGQIAEIMVPQMVNAGADTMHIGRAHLQVAGGQNRPVLENHELNLQDHLDAVEQGFVELYDAISAFGSDLLSEVGPVRQAADCEVRAILRPTATYAMLIRNSRHPDALRDALDQERILEPLWRAGVVREHGDQLAEAELAAMHRGDVPLFHYTPGSRDLISDDGTVVRGWCQQPPLEQAITRIGEFGVADKAKQLWYIRASFASLTRGRFGRRYQLHESQRLPSDDELVAHAVKIGERLKEIANTREGAASWIGLTLVTDEDWLLQPLGPSLYDGTGGVALFLAYLARITGDRRVEELALAASETFRRQQERQGAQEFVGGFVGTGGALYVAAHLARLLPQSGLAMLVPSLCSNLETRILADARLDLLTGVAGCIGGLVSAAGVMPRNVADPLIDACARRLCDTAVVSETGAARWVTQGGSMLTGMSHGAAGIAWALTKAWRRLGTERYRDYAMRAVKFEKELFSPEQGNWPDLRDASSPASYMTAWCHGAVGVGFSRLDLARDLCDSQVEEDLTVALHTTGATGFGFNHSLCHGDLGNIDFMMTAGLWRGDEPLLQRARRGLGVVLDTIEGQGYLCGVPSPHAVETPGLMTGLAGIGYGLLRTAYPAEVPSVLIMQPPVIASADRTRTEVRA